MTCETTATVLYIEDNHANQMLVRLILERRPGVRLITADTGAGGLQEAWRTPPALVLLDISLPDMNGYAVLAALRSHPDTKEVPVVAISGDLPKNQSTPGFARYLKKPIEIAPLFQALDDFLPRT